MDMANAKKAMIMEKWQPNFCEENQFNNKGQNYLMLFLPFQKMILNWVYSSLIKFLLRQKVHWDSIHSWKRKHSFFLCYFQNKFEQTWHLYEIIINLSWFYISHILFNKWDKPALSIYCTIVFINTFFYFPNINTIIS